MGNDSAKTQRRLIAGVMSGTSADGIDVAICEIGPSTGNPWGRLVQHHAMPYAADVRQRIHDTRQTGTTSLAALSRLTRDLTLAHARTVKEAIVEAGLQAGDITAVADHGQTLFHAPPLTMQVLDPALLAWEVGSAVISDFRRADLAAGGQGAPLVPYADLRLFAADGVPRALLNLGGIANVTVLHPNAPPLAFDTGPANCLSDHLCRQHDPAGPGHDEGGKGAERGSVSEEVVRRFCDQPYLAKTPPKSTDGPEMVAAFEAAGGLKLAHHDALATANACVARSIAAALRGATVQEVIASGGGTLNPVLMSALRQSLRPVPLRTSDEAGVPSAAKEAIAFALLGAATLDGLAGNVPSCTGASRPVISGSITPKP